MAKISDKDWFKIQGWMVTKLGLTGAELMAFALVFNLSRTTEGLYKGGIMYLAKWLGCNKDTARKYLHSLKERGYIHATSGTGDSGLFCYYQVDENLRYPSRRISLLRQANISATVGENFGHPKGEHTREQKGEHKYQKKNIDKKKDFSLRLIAEVKQQQNEQQG